MRSTCSVLAATAMAAAMSTGTTRDSERTDLEPLSAFQARFLGGGVKRSEE